MSLSSELVSQFVKATNDTKKAKSETIAYGTVVYDGKLYVKLDGSDLLTPVTTTTDVQDGERVTVMIKNHTATVTGNVSSPAARTEDVKKVGTQITEFENVMAYSITANDIEATYATIDSLYAKVVALEQANVGDLSAVKADIEKLKVNFVDGKNVSADELNAINAEIGHIEAQFGEFENISAGDLEAINADIETLKAYTADFVYVSAEVLKAVRGEIKILDANKIGADQAEFMYANIDFTNITEAAMRNFYAHSGLIEDVVIGDGTITGNLVGVTIRGDLIEGGTVVADKLVIKGEDGLYYKLNYEAGALSSDEVKETGFFKVAYDAETDTYVLTGETLDAVEGSAVDGLITSEGDQVYSCVTSDGEEVYYCTRLVDPEWASNQLHGTAIVAKSITAEKIRVSDLVAFGATIGGFKITDNSIYSHGKESVDSSIRGVYQDNDGQFALGDANNFLRFFKNEDGEYKLEISADSILFSPNSNSSLKALAESDHVKIGTSEGGEPSIELSDDDTAAKQTITSTKTTYSVGDYDGTEIDMESVTTDIITAKKEIIQAKWAWVDHNGNLGLVWRG